MSCDDESVKTVSKRRQEPVPSFRPGTTAIKQVCQDCGCMRVIFRHNHSEWPEVGEWIPPEK